MTAKDTNKTSLSRIAEERRQQIMEAATACFARRGFHQSSMQEVCAEAKMSPGSVYRYFRSKEDIIAALAEEEMRVMDEMFSQLEALPTLAEVLSALTRGWLECFGGGPDADPLYGREGAALYLEVAAEAVRNPRVSAMAHQHDASQVEALAALVRGLQSRNEVDRKLDPGMTAKIMIAVLDGMTLRAVAYEDADPARALEYLDAVQDYLLRMLRPSGAQ